MESTAEMKQRIEQQRRLAAMESDIEMTRLKAQFLARNNHGLREVFKAYPEIDPGIMRNTEELEHACVGDNGIPNPVTLERIQVAFATSDLLSRLELRDLSTRPAPKVAPVQETLDEFAPEPVPNTLSRVAFKQASSDQQRKWIREFGADALNAAWAKIDAADADIPFATTQYVTTANGQTFEKLPTNISASAIKSADSKTIRRWLKQYGHGQVTARLNGQG